jgi:hypothetical protein
MLGLNDKGHSHFCEYHNFMGDYWRIGWSYDFHYKGKRFRSTRTLIRDTDEKGARKFCKKWNIDFPEPTR